MAKKHLIRLTESDMYTQQWKNELRGFMNGLKSGDYFVNNDTVYVQIWKKKTSQDEPRYVYFRMGDTCLHDDNFCVQNSPRLSSRTLNTINSILGWDDEYMMNESQLRKIIKENNTNKNMKKQVIRLTEGDLHRVIKESVNRILKENPIDYWEDAVYKHVNKERLPKGWDKYLTDDGETIYRDEDFNEYIKDEYGKFKLIEN